MHLYTLTEKNCPIVSKISEKILISATHLQDKSSGFNLTKFFASQKFENFLKSSVFGCLFVYDFEKFWRQTVCSHWRQNALAPFEVLLCLAFYSNWTSHFSHPVLAKSSQYFQKANFLCAVRATRKRKIKTK